MELKFVYSIILFILRYLFQDMSPATVHELRGLPLLPLEDGSLGCIGDSTDPTLFLASEVERRLLQGIAKKVPQVSLDA